MRKSDLAVNHRVLDDAIIRYRSFMEKIIAAQRVINTVSEKRDIAESVLLRLLANWEAFVDEQLVDSINIDTSKLSDFLGISIPANLSKNMCEAILFSGGYRDFPSYGSLKGFSKKILPDSSNPFIHVHSSRTSAIDEMYKIRNYLAHYSSAAWRGLMRMYRDRYKYERFIEPGRFLLGNGGEMLWHYFDMLEAASQDMKDWYAI